MQSDFLTSLQAQPFYHLIQEKYRGKVARRSGVSYMNHIEEGAFILHLLYGSNEELQEAYCLHPIFQSDKLLAQLVSESSAELAQITPRALVLGMEYRRVANGYTIKNKIREPANIGIGPLEQVHQMLVADKIQNKKDFMKYIYLKYDRPSYRKVSQHGLDYFDSWLKRLQISPGKYREVVEQLEQFQNGAKN